jgi:DNA-binding NtrC family response regulator
MIVRSERMLKVLDLCVRAARTEANVLFLGECGVGKRRLARFIHASSGRAAAPLIELDAVTFSIDQLETADRGTVVLGNLSELSTEAQGALRHVLDTRRFRNRPLDIRVLSMTESPLAPRTFRTDLLYLLEVIPIAVPPLRERLEEIPALVHAFLARHGRAPTDITDEAMSWLLAQAWPGNVRQLANVIARAVAVSPHRSLDRADVELPDAHTTIDDALDHGLSVAATREVSLEQLERAYIKQVIGAAASMAEAARILRIDRRTLYRKLGG